MLIFCFFSFLSALINQKSLPVDGRADADTLVIEKVYLQTDRDIYSPGEDIWFGIYLADGLTLELSGNSYNLHVELISPDLKIADSRIIKLSGGLGNGDFHLKEDLASGNYLIRCYTNYMRNFGEEYFFRKMIKVIAPGDTSKLMPVNTDDNDYINVAFYPEGGSLAENVPSVVAFKAENSSGSGINVKGGIYTTEGEFKGSFESGGTGMGIIYFTPETGKKYYSLIKMPDGSEVRSDFPEVFRQGIVLNVSGNRSDELDVYFRTNPGTLRLIEDTDLALSVFSKGALFKTVSFRMNTLNGHLAIPTNDLPDGIAVIRLSGPSGLPLCERPVYIHNNPPPEIKILTDKNAYGTRDSVRVEISIPEASNMPSHLSFSAAEESSFSGQYNSTITSWFLMESELKGTVEDPGRYFDGSNPDRFKELDLLLLTQGWRDFKWKYDTMKYPSEYGFTISGRVRKKFADETINDALVNIGLFNGKENFIQTVPVDSSGRFMLDMLDISGTPQVIASIMDDKGKHRGLLKMDSLRYVPEPVGPLLSFKSEEADDTTGDGEEQKSIRSFINSAEYRLSLQKSYKLSDTITPGEVIVRSIRQDAPESARARSRRYLMATPDKEIVITPLLQNYPSTYELIKRRVLSPFKSLSPNNITNPLYMINGAFSTRADVEALSLKWVERIDVLSSENSIAQFKSFRVMKSMPDLQPKKQLRSDDELMFQQNESSGNRDGVISIILKDDADIERISPSYTVNIKMKGYDIPRVFYSPRHSTSLQKDYKPDLRTTLYWKPDISIAKDSIAVLKYFNADNSSRIIIKVEGITDNGIPLTGKAEYIVK